MSDPSKPTVIACAPSTPGPCGVLANGVLNSTGAACVALVLVFPDGSGAYRIAGALEAQLPMPDLLERRGTGAAHASGCFAAIGSVICSKARHVGLSRTAWGCGVNGAKIRTILPHVAQNAAVQRWKAPVKIAQSLAHKG
jgi:hypothetical protein